MSFLIKGPAKKMRSVYKWEQTATRSFSRDRIRERVSSCRKGRWRLTRIPEVETQSCIVAYCCKSIASKTLIYGTTYKNYRKMLPSSRCVRVLKVSLALFVVFQVQVLCLPNGKNKNSAQVRKKVVGNNHANFTDYRRKNSKALTTFDEGNSKFTSNLL